VSPAEFVTLAESTELITPLTDWTLERALSDQQAWRRQLPELRVAVNLSARVLQDANFPGRLAAKLSRFDTDPDLLELEITESAMMLDPDRAQSTVHDLRGLGVQISIDDYGTGFSSLGYLRDLQAHSLKLDKSFVIDLEKREHNRLIVESTARLAHALGMQIVAEGVETEWVRDYLTEIGYDLGQGYLFSRPLEAADCFAWLCAYNAPRQLAG
jgi:EAL domain-containing protein (putative c-di-GMP-specific phosphodiesterase class I)